jgi:HAE1 family hydrophobic/amphiphilic exporter-1/multidrug efflux pump
MAERKLSPKEAAIESMREVTGAIVAIELVLVSVFVPVAFLGGLAGRLYQQFAVTVATAVTISGLVALTLTPALCALLLKPQHSEPLLFRPFNRAFAWITATYVRGVRLGIARFLVALILFGVVIALDALLFRVVPSSFVPPEDQGYVIGGVILPDGATLQRTSRVGEELQPLLAKNAAIDHVFYVSGFDLIGGGAKTNAATMFVPLKPWGERTQSAQDVANFILATGARISDAIVLAFNPPPIRGLGTSGGFELYLQDRATSDTRQLAQQLSRFTDALRQRPELTGINSFFRPTVPQLFVDVDEEKAMALGVPINTIFDALQATMGPLYVNDFNRSGRTFRVQIQADAQYRNQPHDLGNIYVRSATSGEMLPVKSVIHVDRIVGPEQIDRYNGFLAAKVIGSGAPGVSSGQAIAAVEQVAAQTLPTGYTVEWTGQAFQEKRIGTTAIFAFVFAIVMVFLILSANYERWSLPVAVLLAVPFGLFGALVFVWLRGFTNDIYFQIGLLVLIGLAAKNAILIVEFAAQKQAEGLEAGEAAVEAARLRFRPIVMTSLAFILGTLPLAVAVGAGAAARQSMGTGVVGGMLAATFIATVFIPMFYTLLARRHRRDVAAPLPPAPEEEPT